LLGLLLLAGACARQASLENRPCGCALDWVCCPARGVCVRPGDEAGCFTDAGEPPPDAAAPALTPDAAPDGAPDAAPDGAPDAPSGVSFVLPPDGARVQGTVRLALAEGAPALQGLELWVDGQLRATAPGDARFIDWLAFRETLGAHPKAAHQVKVVAIGVDRRRHEEERRLFAVAPTEGDCDSDGAVTAGDLTAAQLEACDGDASDPESAGGGIYPGSPACDVNDDNVIDLADQDCLSARLKGMPDDTCGTPELPAVRTVLFLPREFHRLAADGAWRELVRNKLEEARRYLARHNAGRTFRPLAVELFTAPHERGYYVDGTTINYENVLYDLGLPGYVEPSNKMRAPWNRAVWVFVMGGTDSVVTARFANGHAYALVGDAYLQVARDLDCSAVNPVLPDDPVKQTCLDIWLKSGNPYGHAMGRPIQALLRALGLPVVAADSPDRSTTIMGDFHRYPDVGLRDADRARLAISQFVAGARDPAGAEITVLSPAPGAQVSEPVLIRAIARDNDGVTRLSLSIDDTPVEAEAYSPVEGDLTAAGVEFLWDPSTALPGLRTIHVGATDTFGHADGTSFQVTVIR
jgi:hypothetical protein